MLVKLMKYELMAMARIFLPLFGVLLIVSVVNGLLRGNESTVSDTIGIIVTVFLVSGVFVMWLILVVQRFWRNVFGDEGYLTMTLPVSVDKIIIGKSLVAIIWFVICIIVVAIALLITLGFMFGEWGFMTELLFILRNMQAPGLVEAIAGFTLSVVWIAVWAVGSFASVLLLYLCMSLGMLVNKRRGLVAFCAFIAITTVLQIIYVLIGSVFVVSAIVNYEWLERFAGLSSYFAGQLLISIIALAIVSAQAAVFYFPTRYLLKNKLNLQ